MRRPSLLTLGFIAAAGATALAYDGQELAPQAKVTIERARMIALRAVPNGKIVAQELERERGGSGLRYSFDVRIGSKLREVGIDAKTGRLLENVVQGKNPD